tara:strand:+ start:582 stop:971 length:390 start_codon:yes stop_codon:yes gene_type:complete
MNNNKLKIGSNKNFGIVFSIFFLLLTIYFYLNDKNLNIYLLITSLIFLILGLKNSIILTPLKRIWFKFGLYLGNFVSPVIMGIIFFGVVTPTSILVKIFGKDLLKLRKSNNKTYWLKKDNSNSRMKNQF